jgi:hypothetical protein
MRKIARKSIRQTVAENQATLDFMSRLAGGDGHVNKVIFKEPRKRVIKGPAVYPSEAEVQKSILQYLRGHPMVGWVGRFNSGAFIESYGGHDRYIQANSVKGCSDILGMMKGGIFFAIEVKSHNGRVTVDQNNFILKVLEGGGYAGIARSIDDVNKILGLA